MWFNSPQNRSGEVKTEQPSNGVRRLHTAGISLLLCSFLAVRTETDVQWVEWAATAKRPDQIPELVGHWAASALVGANATPF